MKVLQVITKGEAGGAQSHVLELCRSLPPDVRLAVAIGGAAAPDFLQRHLDSMNVAVHRQPALVNSLAPFRIAAATWALVRLVRRERPDIIHAHSAVAGVAARLAGGLTRTPVVYTVHGFGFKPEVTGLQRRLSYVAEWLLAPLTTRMICVSEHEKLLSRSLPIRQSKVLVVRNGVQELDEAFTKPRGRHGFRVIMVARFALPKRQDLLIQALARTKEQLGVEIPATLVGDGPLLEPMNALARSLGLTQVRFPGVVDRIAALLADHDVFVLASDHEALPISVLEAMRAGLPLLLSKLPGHAELAEGGKAARLLDNDVPSWTQALIELHARSDLREAMGAAARTQFLSRYTSQNMMQSVYSTYHKICANESTLKC